MTDIQERLEHYEAKDRERQELADAIKECDLDLFNITRDKTEPDEEFRATYLQRGIMLRQYRKKYGQKAEEQLRDQLEELRSAYAEQYEAEKNREKLEKQVHLYREAIRYYRDLLNEARDEADVLSCAIDRFTYYHPEYAEEIKALIDDVENYQEDDEE